MDKPIVSIILSVFNGEKYIREAVESILGQTFKKFEFIIINDGSTDGTADILNSYNDKRIRVAHNKTNIGLPKSLNIGIRLSIGIYIARMDCDDISFPQRLEKQVSFMNNHLEIDICGTWIKSFTDKHTSINKYPANSEEIKCMMFWKTGLAHPSVMLRKKTFLNNNLFYDESFSCSQDYDLWVRASKNVKFANIQDVLVARRCGVNNQLGYVSRNIQQRNAAIVRERQLNTLNIYPTEEEKILHESVIMKDKKQTKQYFTKVNDWLVKIKNANQKYHTYVEPYFSDQLSMLWFEYYTTCCENWTWSSLRASPLYSSKIITFRNMLRLIYRKIIQ